MTDRVYKNKFTLDGRVKVVPGVSEKKVGAVRNLLEKRNAGDRIAEATLHEALTTSDAPFNLAHLATLNFIPNFDKAERQWSKLAGNRVVNDLRPVTLYSLNTSWNDGTGPTKVLGAHGEAPTIPEGSAYPYAYISGDVVQGSGVTKKGFKTDWTLESRINDGLGALDGLPEAMRQTSLDTEEAEVFNALLATPNSSQLAGGTVPTGATVAANSKLTRDALIRAQIELGLRTINGRNVTVNGGYNLVVPVGQAIYANFILNQTLVASQNGTAPLVYGYDINGGYNPLANISVVESWYVTGNAWYLIPKPGTTVRPVLEHLSLRGYEAPQLMVDNHNGTYVGGASVPPFEGSFATDVITLKLRQFGGGVVWDNGAGIVWSTGAN